MPPRKKKPSHLAFITEDCTGCAGAPVCQHYCPVDECMVLVQNPGAPAFGVIEVDPLKCIGCRKCVAKGPQGTFLDGCPWDAIVMVPTEEFEDEYGELRIDARPRRSSVHPRRGESEAMKDSQ